MVAQVTTRIDGRRVVLSAFAVFLLVGLTASGARHVIPGLRADTRSPLMRTTRQSKGWRQRFQAAGAKVRSGGAGAQGKIVKVARAVSRAFSFPRLVATPALVGQVHGADAFGTSLPKRLRWKALGGHGRNGPGAGI